MNVICTLCTSAVSLVLSASPTQHPAAADAEGKIRAVIVTGVDWPGHHLERDRPGAEGGPRRRTSGSR